MRTIWTIGMAVLAALTMLAPVRALDEILLVRHAEKVEPWPAGSGIGDLQPLSCGGLERAERLAASLASERIAAIYTSRTTRAVATGAPLAQASGIPLRIDEESTDLTAIPTFLARLRAQHADDRAVLIVGHSNTIPTLLTALGAGAECLPELGVEATAKGPLAESYDGLWRVNLGRPGCAGMVREQQEVPQGPTAAGEQPGP